MDSSVGVAAAGAGAGALVGTVLKPVLGEDLANAAGNVLGVILADLGERTLSRLERRRTVDAARAAAIVIKNRWVQGDDLRTDLPSERTPGSDEFFAELVDGALTAAQREHEERKIQHLGMLIGNLAYEGSIDRGTANWALRTATEMTWLQYCLLAIVGIREVDLPDGVLGESSGDWESWTLHRSLNELRWDKYGLITAPSARTPRMGLAISNRNMRDFSLSSGGVLLHHLLGLVEISAEDLEAIAVSMQARPQDAS